MADLILKKDSERAMNFQSVRFSIRDMPPPLLA